MIWENIYSYFDPVAFHIGSMAIHWYGIMYATALIVAIYFAQYIIKKDKIKISSKLFDSYILWAEIGVILGARIGYVLFYDTHTWYYLSHPWQIFNPFSNGVFVGISGMSFHGALFGFILATVLYCKKHKLNVGMMIDISALSVPLGYIFGRIGNFINQELVGRATDVPWAINIHGTLRHPSQLYEAILEGLVVFLILFLYRKHKKFNGELGILYIMIYSIMRIISEFFRQPDVQLGFLYGTSWMTMGILISGLSFVFASIAYIYIRKYKI